MQNLNVRVPTFERDPFHRQDSLPSSIRRTSSARHGHRRGIPERSSGPALQTSGSFEDNPEGEGLSRREEYDIFGQRIPDPRDSSLIPISPGVRRAGGQATRFGATLSPTNVNPTPLARTRSKSESIFDEAEGVNTDDESNDYSEDEEDLNSSTSKTPSYRDKTNVPNVAYHSKGHVRAQSQNELPSTTKYMHDWNDKKSVDPRESSFVGAEDLDSEGMQNARAELKSRSARSTANEAVVDDNVSQYDEIAYIREMKSQSSLTGQGHRPLNATSPLSFFAHLDNDLSERPPNFPRPTFSRGDRSVVHSAASSSTRERLLSPRMFFRKLEALRANIYLNSYLHLYKQPARVTPPESPSYQLLCPFPGGNAIPSDEEVLTCCNGDQTASSRSFINQRRLLFELLECRNILRSVLSNLVELNSQDYGNGDFNILIVDSHRPNVANLVPLTLFEIENLYKLFEEAVRVLLQYLQTPDKIILDSPYTPIKQACQDLMVKLGLSPPNQDREILWRNTVHTLNLAVVAYCGAHVDDFDQDSLGRRISELDVVAPFSNTSESIVLVRRQLQCLEDFAGSEGVWVFQHNKTQRDGPLYVSATINEFANIWGPLWGVYETRESKYPIQYDLARGSIIHWPYDALLDPPLRRGEVFCHWIPSRESEDLEPADRKQDGSTALAFSGDENLLIGAPEIKRLQWQNCSRWNLHVLSKLTNTAFTHPLSTSNPRYYRDSVNLAIGPSQFVQGGLGITWKKTAGTSLKDVIVSEFEHGPERFGPQLFEYFYGLCISLCTSNARRVRLIDLLRTPSMLRWLERYQWPQDNHLRGAFFYFVRSGVPNALTILWEDNPHWREHISKALGWCILILRFSGLQRDRFTAVWVPPNGRIVKGIEYLPINHPWMYFLNDTRDSCTFAVAVEDSLAEDYHGGRHCGRHDFASVLETAIDVTAAVKPSHRLKALSGTPRDGAWRAEGISWRRWYDLSELGSYHDFYMGDRGKLRILRTGPPSTRLLAEWTSSMRNKYRIPLRSGMGHYEYTGEIENWMEKSSEFSMIRPIPVHVTSAKLPFREAMKESRGSQDNLHSSDRGREKKKGGKIHKRKSPRNSEKELARPISFIKVHRRDVTPLSLQRRNLAWEYDDQSCQACGKLNSHCILIRQWLSERETDEIFNETRRIRKKRK